MSLEQWVAREGHVAAVFSECGRVCAINEVTSRTAKALRSELKYWKRHSIKVEYIVASPNMTRYLTEWEESK